MPAEPDVAGGGGSWAGGAAKSQHPGYADLAQRMEIIAPSEIQLVKFLGAGGYGEVRRGLPREESRVFDLIGLRVLEQ